MPPTDQRPSQPGPDTEEQAYPGRWRALAVTLVVGFMTLLDVTIVNVAIPSIQRGLHASPQGVQWIVSGYALTFGLTLVAGGRLGDAFGRRRMFLLGLVAFTATSAAAGAATSETWIVAARLAQGVAAGLLTPQNAGLIQALFRGAERGRAFGIFGTTVGVSAATGPVLGGLILTAFGGRRRRAADRAADRQLDGRGGAGHGVPAQPARSRPAAGAAGHLRVLDRAHGDRPHRGRRGPPGAAGSGARGR